MAPHLGEDLGALRNSENVLKFVEDNHEVLLLVQTIDRLERFFDCFRSVMAFRCVGEREGWRYVEGIEGHGRTQTGKCAHGRFQKT